MFKITFEKKCLYIIFFAFGPKVLSLCWWPKILWWVPSFYLFIYINRENPVLEGIYFWWVEKYGFPSVVLKRWYLMFVYLNTDVQYNKCRQIWNQVGMHVGGKRFLKINKYNTILCTFKNSKIKIKTYWRCFQVYPFPIRSNPCTQLAWGGFGA